MREGEAAGTVGHLQKLSEYGEYRAVYWPGALYVHHFSYVIRYTHITVFSFNALLLKTTLILILHTTSVSDYKIF